MAELRDSLFSFKNHCCHTSVLIMSMYKAADNATNKVHNLWITDTFIV